MIICINLYFVHDFYIYRVDTEYTIYVNSLPVELNEVWFTNLFSWKII